MSASTRASARPAQAQASHQPSQKGKASLRAATQKPLTLQQQATLTDKITLIDEKSKETFLGSLKETYEKQFELLRLFYEQIQVLKGTPHEHLLSETDASIQTLNFLLSSVIGATEARAEEQKKEAQIAKLLEARKIHEMSSAHQEGLQQTLRNITPVPSSIELQYRLADLKALTNRLKAFNERILENQALINKEDKSLNAKSFDQVRLEKVTPLVGTLQANREELSKEAEFLKKYAVESFKRLEVLNVECKKQYPTLASTDTQFVRSAGVHMQSIKTEVEFYQDICDLAQRLKKREGKMEKIWDEICSNANRMSTDTRYLIHVEREKKIPGYADYVVALGRPWVGKDKYVDSFAFGTLKQSAGMLSWIFGSSTPAPAASSTDPV